MTLKTLAVNFFWIIFFLLIAVNAQARNEYLNDGNNGNCSKGSFETYSEVNQRDYKSGTSAEWQDQTVGFRYRMNIGSSCSDEFVGEQQLQMKLKTQMELIKSCRSIPRISPPPPKFAELIGACLELGVMKTTEFETFDKSISYWEVLKADWLKENPGVTIFKTKGAK